MSTCNQKYDFHKMKIKQYILKTLNEKSETANQKLTGEKQFQFIFS